jgi:hemoglobin
VALSVTMAGSGQVGVRASAARPAQQAGASLYQELGGYDGIVKFVALVFPRVAEHPRLTHLFRGHGQDSQQRQFQMVVELVCNRTGGPCTYLGRPMGPVHAGLKITAENWSTFMDIVTAGMTELGYAEPLKQRFTEVWKAFRGDVVDADRDAP